MKSLLTLALAISAFAASAQWQIINVADDPFNKPYTICANKATTGDMMMKMEWDDKKSAIWLYVNASYLCEDYPTVQFNGKINGEWVPLFNGKLFVASHKLVLLSRDFHGSTWSEQFLQSTEVAIKILDGRCDTETAIFDNADASKAASSWATNTEAAVAE